MQGAHLPALAAEAWLSHIAWNYTVTPSSDKLTPVAARAAELIEMALSRDTGHPLAHHLKIHLLETQQIGGSSGGAPGKGLQGAVDAAEGLLANALKADATGHLLHMPVHSLVRVGRWRDAIAVCCSVGSLEGAEMARIDMHLPEHDAGKLCRQASGR